MTAHQGCESLTDSVAALVAVERSLVAITGRLGGRRLA